MAGLLEAPQRKIRLGSLCGDVRWAHAGADCRAALLQRARGKRIERAGEEEGRAREDCARTREAGRARGSRDAEWSSIGINAEGAPRFSEWDCEASSLPNPLETDFRR